MSIPVPSGYEVYWEKWVDAYQQENHITKYPDEEEANDFEDLAELEPFRRPIKTIMTPFGILPLTEQSLASNHFKFWTGHTNFRITQSLKQVIEKCEGIETLDLLTPYRFRIGIAKMFQDRDVMHNVRRSLLGFINNKSED